VEHWRRERRVVGKEGEGKNQFLPNFLRQWLGWFGGVSGPCPVCVVGLVYGLCCGKSEWEEGLELSEFCIHQRGCITIKTLYNASFLAVYI
jgi:hypothetical protein